LGVLPRIKKGDEMKKLPTLKELEGTYKPKELKDLTDEEVLKIFEGVETVWDYEPTEDEKGGVGIERFKNKADYFRRLGNKSDYLNRDLFLILFFRNELEQADKYYQLVQHKEIKDKMDYLTSGFDIFP
jgi:hypothetical protein